MKPKLSLAFLLSFISYLLSSQIPQGFNYQAVLRDDPTNNPIVSQSVQIRFTIQTAGAVVVYQETHATTTDEFGTISLVIGGGTPVGAFVFSDIDWSVPLYLKTEFEYPVSGTPDYDKLMGTTALKSVPYALAADGFTQPLEKLTVRGNTSSFEEPLFEVKNTSGNTVFAVYNEGVRIYVGDGAVKGPKGGFAIGGFDSEKDENAEKYLFVSDDSVRVYINDNAKSAKGGFAIGGYGSTKGLWFPRYLRVTSDSTRVMTTDPVQGFGVKSGTTGSYLRLTPENYFIGHGAGRSITLGQYNSFIGYEAGKASNIGGYNIFLGYKAGLRNTEGTNNVFLGNEAGVYNTLGSYNIFIGNSSGRRNEDGTHNTYIGFESGYYGGYLSTDPSYNTYVGYQSGKYSRTGQYNTFVGHKAGYSGTAASGDANVFIGDSAGFSNVSGDDNVFIGKASGQGSSTGKYNVILGSRAGYLNNGDYNVFVGYESGLKNISGADSRFSNYNTFIGFQTGRENTTGWHNIAIGYKAGYSNQTATNQFFIGDNSGEMLTVGYGNTFAGHLTGAKATDCSYNTFIGYQTGYFNLTGDNNTLLGYTAGINIKGSDNTLLGYKAGYNNADGSGNVFIGSSAGYDEAGSEKLYIDNSSTPTPLIYGDFTNTSEFVQINGKLGIGVQPTTTQFAVADLPSTSSGSYVRYYNNHFYSYSSSRETKENIKPLIEDFSKILNADPVSFTDKASGENHIGYIAEDFDAIGLNNLVIYKEGKPISLSYELVSLYNLEIIKDQQKEIKTLNSKIDKLEQLVNQLIKEK